MLAAATLAACPRSSLSSRYRRRASTVAALSSPHLERTAPRKASAAWNLAPAEAVVESRTARAPSRQLGEARKERRAVSAVERVAGFCLGFV